MSLFIGILLFAGLLLYAGVRFLLFPSLTENRATPPVTWSWIIACLFLSTLFGIHCFYYIAGYFFLPPDGSVLFSGNIILYLITGTVALLLMPFLQNKSLFVQVTVIFAFCFVGSTLVSAPVGINALLFQALFALVWTGIILLNTVLDRIPLISFVTNSSVMLVLALASSSFFQILPMSLLWLYLSALFLHLVIFLFMKKADLPFEFFPIVFLLNWIIGYAFLTFASQGNIVYSPIFFGYSLMELCVAVLTRLFGKKAVVLFAVEQAFIRRAPVKIVIKKVFYTVILLGIIALAGIKTNQITLKYCSVVYGMAMIVLYNFYWSLTRNMTKVTLRSTVKDMIMGFKSLLTVGQSWVENAPDAALKAEEKQQSVQSVQPVREKTSLTRVSKSVGKTKKKKSTRVRGEKLKK